MFSFDPFNAFRHEVYLSEISRPQLCFCMCLSEERMWEPLSSGDSRSPFSDVEQKVKMTPHRPAEFKGGFNAMDISNASLVGKKKRRGGGGYVDEFSRSAEITTLEPEITTLSTSLEMPYDAQTSRLSLKWLQLGFTWTMRNCSS